MTIVVSDKITGVFSPMNGEAFFILGGVPHAVTNMINNQNALKIYNPKLDFFASSGLAGIELYDFSLLAITLQE